MICCAFCLLTPLMWNGLLSTVVLLSFRSYAPVKQELIRARTAHVPSLVLLEIFCRAFVVVCMLWRACDEWLICRKIARACVGPTSLNSGAFCEDKGDICPQLAFHSRQILFYCFTHVNCYSIAIVIYQSTT